MPQRPLAVRIYAWLARRTMPSAFRARHGDRLAELFSDNWMIERAVRSRQAMVWLFVVETAALLLNAVREHAIVGRSGNAVTRVSGYRPEGERMKSISFLLQDMRYAIRFLRKRSGFTAVAAATLALGIGANTAIFSVVHGVLMEPLPYDNEDRLVMVWPELRARGVTDWPASDPDVRDFRQAESFDEVAAVRPFRMTLTGEGWAERVEAVNATTNFLATLGVRPMLGRLFNEDDAPQDPDPSDQNAEPFSPAVILSHGLWQRRFGGDVGVVGSTIDIMGVMVHVVGVLPSDFELFFPSSTGLPPVVDLWIASPVDLQNEVRRNVWWRVLARLRPSVTITEAQAEMDILASRLRQEIQLYSDVDFHVNVIRLRDDLVEQARPMVLALYGAVGFVLLIACANVANLLLVRATARTREISVRAALGGNRWQLMRQMLSESLVLSLLGAGLGLALAQAGIRVLVMLRPADLPRLDSIGIDGVVAGYALLASFVAVVLFGMLPALRGSRANVALSLMTRSDGGGGIKGRALQNGMVALEVALSLVLLIGAGLMVRSSVALARVDPGFDPVGVLTFETAVPPGVFRGAEQRGEFVRELRERIASLAGIDAVGAARPLPLTNRNPMGRYGTEAALSDESLFKQALYRSVAEGYLESMRTRITAGRDFSPAEYADGVPVVMVDQVLAESMWPTESAVGKRLIVRPVRSEPINVEVVGVVEHQRHADLSSEGRPTVYFPRRLLSNPLSGLSWTVRTAGDPLALVEVIRAEVEAINPNIPLTDVRTLQDYVDSARAPTRFALILIGVFGVSALLLASVGLYGVLAYAVQQRNAEIGIRMAFGANANTILRMVARQGLRLVVIGVGTGLLGAFGLTRFMEALLVGVLPTDPLTYLGIVSLFVGVAALACYLPSRRATRVDPVEALREG